jgi:hypothetical protein
VCSPATARVVAHSRVRSQATEDSERAAPQPACLRHNPLRRAMCLALLQVYEPSCSRCRSSKCGPPLRPRLSCGRYPPPPGGARALLVSPVACRNVQRECSVEWIRKLLGGAPPCHLHRLSRRRESAWRSSARGRAWCGSRRGARRCASSRSGGGLRVRRILAGSSPPRSCR